jgi:CHAD domain-containing protein
MPFRILRYESVEHAVRRIAGEQIDKAISETEKVGGDSHETIHQVRKRCKKIRALIRLIRPQLREIYDLENAWYRDSAKSLSKLRDAQTIVESFESLMTRVEDPIDREAYAAVRRQLILHRERVVEDQIDPRARLRELGERMKRGRERLESWVLEDSGFDALAAGLGRTYSQGRKAMKRVRRTPSTESIHEWRKRMTDHWYHMRLLRGVRDDVMRARRNDADVLSHCLGDDHDLSVLREILWACKNELDQRALQDFFRDISRRQLELKGEAETLGRRLLAETRKHFVERIEGYWDAWQRDTNAPVSHKIMSSG